MNNALLLFATSIWSIGWGAAYLKLVATVK